MLETEKKRCLYLKFLVMSHPLKELQNMMGTLKTIHQLAEEEEIDILRKLDYIGLRAKDIPLLERLDSVKEKLRKRKTLMSITSEAMLIKTNKL